MELLILNPTLEPVAIIDSFVSLIWTERFFECGDFEIYIKAEESILNILQADYYVWRKDSEYLMVIEGRQIVTDSENGDHLIITGRSIESILDRRIIWDQTILTGNLQNGIEKLLNESVIVPTITERIIPNFDFEASIDSTIIALTVDAQFTRTNLYESIRYLCLLNDIGFKILLSETTGHFVFKLYSGVDRSYNQLTNPYVIFSPKFENLANSNYSETQRNLKTLTVVAGEGEGSARKTTIVGGGTGLTRREMYTDARDLTQEVDSVMLSDEDYLAQLAQRGLEDLTEYVKEEYFDGKAETSRMFEYRKDFFLGDLVQMVNEHNIQRTVRVSEVIYSQSVSGIDIYPTFTIVI